MCGRFALKTHAQQLRKLFGLIDIPDIIERFNIAPSQKILAIVENNKAKIPKWFQWGLIPHWAKPGFKPLINARAETIDEKPSFRDAFKTQRCLIPASGFYEWKKMRDGKHPYYIHMKHEEPFAFAGIISNETAAIITTTPNEVMKPIHQRMPAIIPMKQYDAWLAQPIKSLLTPFDAEAMQAKAVSHTVNNPRNDGPDCLAPDTFKLEG